jgi:hypothetical protein
LRCAGSRFLALRPILRKSQYTILVLGAGFAAALLAGVLFAAGLLAGDLFAAALLAGALFAAVALAGDLFAGGFFAAAFLAEVFFTAGSREVVQAGGAGSGDGAGQSGRRPASSRGPGPLLSGERGRDEREDSEDD